MNNTETGAFCWQAFLDSDGISLSGRFGNSFAISWTFQMLRSGSLCCLFLLQVTQGFGHVDVGVTGVVEVVFAAFAIHTI